MSASLVATAEALASLDFEPRCEGYISERWRPCDGRAEWWRVLSCGCRKLLCDDCHEYDVALSARIPDAPCPRCWTPTLIIEYRRISQ